MDILDIIKKPKVGVILTPEHFFSGMDRPGYIFSVIGHLVAISSQSNKILPPFRTLLKTKLN